jgi:hypothetical protein
MKCILFYLVTFHFTTSAISQNMRDSSSHLASGHQDPRRTFDLVDTGDLATDKGCSRGIAFGDLNGDSLADAVVANCNNQNIYLYLNAGNGFFRRITEGSVAETTGYFESSSLIDYDNDGDLDIFLTTLNNQPDYLFRNDGNAKFEVVQAGQLTSDSSSAPGSCWCDYDADGDIDVYIVTRGTAHDILYNNTGNGVFIRVAGSQFPYSAGDGRSCSWGDIDGDGDFDLYVGNFVEIINGERYNARNNLYINNGDGGFTQTFTGDHVTDRGRTYGTSFVDFDNDGDADLMVTNIGARDSSVLYSNDGSGRFTNLLPEQSGLRSGKPSKGHTWGDFDNDGFLDLFVANGTENVPDSLLDDDIYYGNADRKLTKINGRHPTIDRHVSAGTAFADVDLDGDLDLFVCNWKNNNEKNAWYINNSVGTRWIRIGLKGTVSNRMGIGAKVELRGEVSGEQIIQTRWMFPQTGFASQNENVIHFGLPGNFVFKSLRVVWPSRKEQQIHTVPTNRMTEIKEPAS